MGEAGLRGRANDVTGLVLIVVALISLLALFGDRAGIAGRLLESVMSVSFGVFRYLVPVGLAVMWYLDTSRQTQRKNLASRFWSSIDCVSVLGHGSLDG